MIPNDDTEQITLENKNCDEAGFVTVPKLNVMGLPPGKAPDAKLTVRTCPVNIAVPAAPDAGDVKVSAVFEKHESPLPVKLMTSFPVDGTAMAGVRVIDIVTPVAPRITLLSVMAGFPVPNEPSTIAGNVPTELDPCSTLLPSSTPAATELSAACAAVGFVTVPKLNVMGLPPGKVPNVKLTVST